MKLFIKVEQDRAIDHPMTLSDLRRIFPGAAPDNLPKEFKRFIRSSRPTVGVFEVEYGPVYEVRGDAVYEVWSVRPMTERERSEKIALASSQSPFPSWWFNQETCGWFAPTPYPEDGRLYSWDETLLQWIALPDETQGSVIKREVVQATQQRLDNFARTRNYDGILSLCTYATSTVPKFQAEGQYGVTARDATWATLYQILAEVEAGTRPVPSGYADIEPDLPALAWPA